MFKLFRIDYEWDEYLGAEQWETHTRYHYVAGFSRLGRACYDLMRDEDNTIKEIVPLIFSLRGLWVCLRNTDSQFKNLTQR